MKSTTKKNIEIAGVVGVGLAALAAGAIFLYGKDGAKRRKQVKSWMLKAKGDVLEKLENLEDFSQASYNRIVDEVASHYKQLKNIDSSEIVEMVTELKGHFNSIQKQLNKKPTKKVKKK
ncbi:MAG TPA: hypothetical protein VJI96_00970 [Candidatus Andersenbacteria bacterium]|nr:hypothetical protein [Candidatus Andersenbacteria bacterium]